MKRHKHRGNKPVVRDLKAAGGGNQVTSEGWIYHPRKGWRKAWGGSIKGRDKILDFINRAVR